MYHLFIPKEVETYSNFYRKSDTLSLLISTRIYECNIKFFTIWDQEISVKEFHFLIKSGLVEGVVMNSRILDENGKNIGLEEILSALPRIRYYT